eukprot:SAG31_NODE_1018_length_10354_cov_10.995514_6_plen_85_part_00
MAQPPVAVRLTAMMSGLAAIFGVSPEPEALAELDDFDFDQLPPLDDSIEVQNSETGQTAVIAGVPQVCFEPGTHRCAELRRLHT